MEISEQNISSDAHHWYIAYTLPRHEKAVAHRLRAQNVHSYVPLYSEVRHWRERRVSIDLPLFPSYVFVRMRITEKGRVMSDPSIIRLLTANGRLSIFPDDTMDSLQASIARWKVRPYPFLVSGRRIRVTSGPFAGLEGTIIRRNGNKKLVITLDPISSSIVLELDSAAARLAS